MPDPTARCATAVFQAAIGCYPSLGATAKGIMIEPCIGYIFPDTGSVRSPPAGHPEMGGRKSSFQVFGATGLSRFRRENQTGKARSECQTLRSRTI